MWNPNDQTRALAQGWGVFDNSDHGERIERSDAAGRFDCDAAAQAYVGRMAIGGDILARRAFQHLADAHAVNDAAESDLYA